MSSDEEWWSPRSSLPPPLPLTPLLLQSQQSQSNYDDKRIILLSPQQLVPNYDVNKNKNNIGREQLEDVMILYDHKYAFHRSRPDEQHPLMASAVDTAVAFTNGGDDNGHIDDDDEEQESEEEPEEVERNLIPMDKFDIEAVYSVEIEEEENEKTAILLLDAAATTIASTKTSSVHVDSQEYDTDYYHDLE